MIKLIIRFGFVAMSLELKNASPSKTVTLKTLEKLANRTDQISRIERIAKENLENSFRILRHCVFNGISLYRFSSKLVPLATHPLTKGWDYPKALKKQLFDLGKYIKQNKIRVSAHPDHYTVLNSPKQLVLSQSINDLIYHFNLFREMGLEDEGKLVLHVGGVYGDKQLAMKRFISNFNNLDEKIQQSLLLENDDKSYSAQDVLKICTTIEIPMVLDVHHHQCLSNRETISALLPDVFATWKGQLPKIHFSSPRSEKDFRYHADDINLNQFLRFLEQAKKVDRDFDVMLEAKNKDLALFKLLDQLAKEGIKLTDKASIQI